MHDQAHTCEYHFWWIENETSMIFWWGDIACCHFVKGRNRYCPSFSCSHLSVHLWKSNYGKWGCNHSFSNHGSMMCGMSKKIQRMKKKKKHVFRTIVVASKSFQNVKCGKIKLILKCQIQYIKNHILVLWEYHIII